MFFTLVSLVFHCQIYAVVFHVRAPPLLLLAVAHNNEEMAFVYMEIHVFLALLVLALSYEYSVGHRHSAGEYEAVSCKNEGKYLYCL